MDLFTFRVGDRIFSVDVMKVMRVKKKSAVNVRDIPNVPEYILGIADVDGMLVTIIDIRKIFKKSSENTKERIIIVNTKEDSFLGLLVDDIYEVVYLDESELKPPPPPIKENLGRIVSGLFSHKNDMVILLDPVALETEYKKAVDFNIDSFVK